MRLVISDEAHADLLHIDTYLAERNPAAADDVAAVINRKFGNLLHFPFIGRSRGQLGVGFRSVVAGYYVIFYFADADEVTIVRVLDGRMDVDAQFLP